MQYVAYYRVSTQKQGVSGLGLEAQQSAVENYLGKQGGDSLIKSFKEVESGNNKERPQLQKALDFCKQHGAKLLIAKLDRLSRSLHFITGLMESGVDFVACDMPDANKLTIHIISAVAEAERDAISERTKAAYKSHKNRGDSRWGKVSLPTIKKRRDKKINYLKELKPLLDDLSDKTIEEQVEELNFLGIKTRYGKDFTVPVLYRMKREMKAYEEKILHG